MVEETKTEQLEEKIEEEVVEDKFGEDPESASEATEDEVAKDDTDEITKEILDDLKTDEAKETPEQKSDAAFERMRKDLKESSENQTRLEGQIQQLTTQISGGKTETETVVEKSPVELAAEEQEVDVDDVDMNYGLHKRQVAWDAKQTKVETDKTSKETLATQQEESIATVMESLTTEKAGKGLDFNTILTEGNELLTRGEKLDIADSENYGQACYDKCLEAIQKRGTKEQKTDLQSRIDAHKPKAKDSETTPKKKENQKEDQEEVKDEGTEQDTEPLTHNARIAAFMGGESETM